MKPLRIKNARRRIEVSRDEDGVPHIVGPSYRDVIYGLGFMHAVDRPTQMLFSRAVASGRSAEKIADKPELLEMDRFFRRVGLNRNLDPEVDRLDDVAFGHITAYCEGVNDGMKHGGRSLPMWATGFQPKPWDQQAIMLVGNLLNFGGLAVGQQQSERLIVELIQAGVGEQRLRALFDPHLNEADFELLKQVKIERQLSDDALELITDLPRLAGSNAWAVAPQRSASGHALLASDPHLEVNRLPSIWYEVVLSWNEDDYVMGATLPGCPSFGVARTSELAWGVTYLKGDTSDYFIEDVRQGPNGWQYRRGEDWYDFEVREETIHRKGGEDDTLKVYSNDLGTLQGNPDADGPGYHLLVSWTGDHGGVGKSLAIWIELPNCDDAAQAMDLVRELPHPTLYWVFADREGHIGGQASGWFPKRRAGHSGLIPVPAWDEANHWQGWVDSERLPRIYDPPEGFIASANENVNEPGGPTLVSLPVPDYRKRRIVERLEQLPDATLEDMQHLQYDVVSMQARDLLEILLPYLPDGEIKERLSAWDCDYSPKSTEATLFHHLYRNILLEIFGQDPDESGGIGWRRMLYLCSRVGFSLMVITCIDRLLKKDVSPWWHKRDKGELIRRAAEQLKGEPDQPWSAINAFSFTNRFFEDQFVGSALGFHSGEIPMPGCHATPFQGHVLRSARREETFAPSYHFTTDLGTDQSHTNLPGGPSESRFSKFYRIDIPKWITGEYKKLVVG